MKLAIGPVVFAVSTQDAAARAWMSSYVPEAGDDEPPAFRLEHIRSSTRLAELKLDRDQERGYALETFKGIWHKRFTRRSLGSPIFFSDPDEDHCVYWNGDIATIVVDESSREGHRLPLRVAREVVYRRLLSQGRVPLHAAAIAFGGRGAAIVGPSGAGKTTLLLHLLRGGAEFLSNDRAMVQPHSGELVALPLPIRIGYGSLIGDKHLARQVATAGPLSRHDGNSFSERTHVESSAYVRGSSQKLELSPKELCRALGSTYVRCATLRLLLIPSLDLISAGSEICIEAVGRDEAMGILLPEVTAPTDRLWPQPWIQPGGLSKSEAAAGIEAIIDTVPVLRVCWGIEATPAAIIAAISSNAAGLMP